jgi:hypothetical protein
MAWYDLLMIWLAPLCWPAGMASAAAFVTTSRFVFVAPIAATLFVMAAVPSPREGGGLAGIESLSQHMHAVALVAGIVGTTAALFARLVVKSLHAAWYRSPPVADRSGFGAPPQFHS